MGSGVETRESAQQRKMRLEHNQSKQSPTLPPHPPTQFLWVHGLYVAKDTPVSLEKGSGGAHGLTGAGGVERLPRNTPPRGFMRLAEGTYLLFPSLHWAPLPRLSHSAASRAGTPSPDPFPLECVCVCCYGHWELCPSDPASGLSENPGDRSEMCACSVLGTRKGRTVARGPLR